VRFPLEKCAGIQPGEVILIVTDEISLEVAKSFGGIAKDYGDIAITIMKDRNNHGEEPPITIAAAMATADVIFGVTKYSLTHSKARRGACNRGARFVNMADYNILMLESGGIFVDFERQSKVVDMVAKRLVGNYIEITSSAGTKLNGSIKGMKPVPQYGRSLKKGAASSPPIIECAIGPVENTLEGNVIIDGSIPHPSLGLLNEDIRLTVERGVIKKIEGGIQANILRDMLKEIDEGVLGTIHLGIGNSIIFGGNNSINIHIDLIFKKPTCSIDNKLLLKEGQLVLE